MAYIHMYVCVYIYIIFVHHKGYTMGLYHYTMGHKSNEMIVAVSESHPDLP